jgi:hypothetical protein
MLIAEYHPSNTPTKKVFPLVQCVRDIDEVHCLHQFFQAVTESKGFVVDLPRYLSLR